MNRPTEDRVIGRETRNENKKSQDHDFGGSSWLAPKTTFTLLTPPRGKKSKNKGVN